MIDWVTVAVNGLFALIVLLFIALVGFVVYRMVYPPAMIEIVREDWRCTRDHQDVTMIPMSIDGGKTTTMMPQLSTVCDEYRRK